MTRYAPKWFEDFEVGARFKSDRYTLTAESIKRFAREYDPQPFHLDKVYAEASVYGSIIASGFQTQLVAFRLAYQSGIFGHNRGGKGIDELRWTSAVRAGDTIETHMTIRDKKVARTTGHLVVDYEVINQRDETVMTATFNYVIAKRPAAS